VQARRDELELKLIVPADFQMPPLENPSKGVLTASEEAPLRLSATYFDTADLSLLGHGMTLRYRTGDQHGPVWTLKLSVNGDSTLRSELEFAGDSEQPPAEALTLLFAFLKDNPLVPVAEIKTRRRRWSLGGNGGAKLAELVDDLVSVFDGKKIRQKFREIEIEADTIDRRGLERIASRMRKAGAKPEQRSKASRALEALHKLKPAENETIASQDPAETAVRPALAAALRRILTYDPHARLGDTEGVHQLRVSARRLRSVIRTFLPIVRPEKVETVVEDLRWLGQVLGAVRDLDVIDLRLHSETQDEAAAPVFQALAARRAVASAELAVALTSERYVNFLQRVKELTTDDDLTIDSPGSCREVLPKLVLRMWKRLRKPGEALQPDSAEADFHRVRIMAKRARYSAETVAGFLRPRTKLELKAFAEGAEAVQNILGEHQDAAFARTILMEIAAQHPEDDRLMVCICALVERQEQDAKVKREEFFKEWQRLDRKKNTKWAN
jgi:CHAD domain-containing protein